MTTPNNVLPFSAALEKGLKRLIEHEHKILSMLPNLFGRPMTIRSDTWEIRIHDSPQHAFDYARDAMAEQREHVLDIFFRVIGESSDPSLEKIWDDAGMESVMQKHGDVSVIDKSKLN